MSQLVEHKPDSPAALSRPAPSASGLAALLAGGRAETAKALADAVKACHAVEKAATNDFHKYKYASADAIIDAGRQALAAAGLALLPIEASLNGSEREGADRFELVRTFVLLHTSGETTPLRVCWPVVPDRGRPLDKATAAADTLSLSYLLRDLLLMPRVDPSDDVNAREDRSQPEKPRKGRGLPADGAELEARLVRHEQALVAAGRCKQGELMKHVFDQYALRFAPHGGMDGVPPLTRWSEPHIRLAVDATKAFDAAHPVPAAAPPPAKNGAQPAPPAAKITAEQTRELMALMERKGRKWPLIVEVFELPKLTMPADLTPQRFDEITKALNEEPDAQAARK